MRVIVWTIAIVTASAVAWTNTAQAADEPAPQSDPAAKPEEKGPEHARVNLGVGLAAFGSGNGWQVFPMASLGFELHAVGPLWVAASLDAGYWEAEGDGFSASQNKWVAGKIGPRVEAPIFDWLEAGGYALFVGSYGVWTDGFGEAKSMSVGASAGVSAHLRATPFFGVRLLVDAVHVSKMWSRSEGVEGDAIVEREASTTMVDFTPRPQVQLTFTF